VYRTVGKYPQAIGLFRRNILPLTDSLTTERFGLHSLPSVLARVFSADCLSMIGEFEEGLVAWPRSSRDRRGCRSSLQHRGCLCRPDVGHLRKRDLGTAIPYIERGFDLCVRWGIGPWLRQLRAIRALADAPGGRLTDAGAVLQEVTTFERGVESTTMADLGRAFQLTGISMWRVRSPSAPCGRAGGHKHVLPSTRSRLSLTAEIRQAAPSAPQNRHNFGTVRTSEPVRRSLTARFYGAP
jgi:hypothetical protein